MTTARSIGRVSTNATLMMCFIFLLGAQIFSLPVIAPIGSTALLIFGPWLVIVPLAIGIFKLRFWSVSRSCGAILWIIMAGAATGWASVALARMLAECETHGVPISLLRAFGVRFLPGWQPDDDLVYGQWQGQPLHLVVYKPGATSSGKSAPVLLYIHGGGFSTGDRFESGTNLRWFADRGWLVLSIDYTLSSVDRHLWDTTTSQVGCAMVWTAANVPRMGGDPGRLSLLGSSAGGNLAINAAYLANAGKLESSCHGTVPRVSAVGALYPAVDLKAAWFSHVPVISDMARKFDTNYLGGSPLQYPDRYQLVNSVTHINSTAPPTLVILGDHDHMVPPDATDNFVQHARSAGIDVESVRLPYADHGFNLNQDGIGNQFYLGMTYRYLLEHGQ